MLVLVLPHFLESLDLGLQILYLCLLLLDDALKVHHSFKRDLI